MRGTARPDKAMSPSRSEYNSPESARLSNMCDEPHLSLALGIKAAESTLFPHKSFQFVAPGPPVELDEGPFPARLSRRVCHRFTAPASIIADMIAPRSTGQRPLLVGQLLPDQ